MSYATALHLPIDTSSQDDHPAAATLPEQEAARLQLPVDRASADEAAEQALQWFADLTWCQVLPMATVMLTLVVGFLVFAPLLALVG